MMMICKGDKKVVRKAFSLIEMLAVITIIAILGSLAIGGYIAATGNAKEARTKTAIKAVATAFETIKAKKGFYPQVITTGTNSDKEKGMYNNICWIALEKKGRPQSLICTLAFKPNIATASSVANPIPKLDNYVNKSLAEEFVKVVDLNDFVKKYCGYIEDSTHRRYYLKDGWGNPIFYNCPGYFNPMSFDLISTGDGGFMGDPKPTSGTAQKLFDVKSNEITLGDENLDFMDVKTYKSQGTGSNSGDGLGTVDDIVNK